MPGQGSGSPLVPTGDLALPVSCFAPCPGGGALGSSSHPGSLSPGLATSQQPRRQEGLGILLLTLPTAGRSALRGGVGGWRVGAWGAGQRRTHARGDGGRGLRGGPRRGSPAAGLCTPGSGGCSGEGRRPAPQRGWVGAGPGADPPAESPSSARLMPDMEAAGPLGPDAGSELLGLERRPPFPSPAEEETRGADTRAKIRSGRGRRPRGFPQTRPGPRRGHPSAPPASPAHGVPHGCTCARP